VNYTKFRHLAIERTKPPPTEGQILAIETLLGAPLPASFRDFLQVANGGYLDYVVDVPVGDGQSEELCFCSIFSADEGNFCDETFLGEIRSARQYQKIPPGVLPFARDGGGSAVYLDLSPQGRGRVVAFVEGLPEWTGLRTQSAFIELAASFDEYVDKLRIDRNMVLFELPHAKSVAQLDATQEWLDIAIPSWRDDPELAAALRDARQRLSNS
jgi:hypothetical protein